MRYLYVKVFLVPFSEETLKQRFRRQDSACCRGKNNPYSQDLEVQCNITVVLFLEQTENPAHLGRFKIIVGVFLSECEENCISKITFAGQ